MFVLNSFLVGIFYGICGHVEMPLFIFVVILPKPAKFVGRFLFDSTVGSFENWLRRTTFCLSFSAKVEGRPFRHTSLYSLGKSRMKLLPRLCPKSDPCVPVGRFFTFFPFFLQYLSINIFCST